MQKTIKRPEHNIIIRSTLDGLEPRKDYLLVGKQGDPDFTARPEAINRVKIFANTGVVDSKTFLTGSLQASAERYVQAHNGLVAPMQKFLKRGNRAAKVSRVEGQSACLIVRMSRSYDAAVVAHVVYPSLDAGEAVADHQIASALFVSRCLAHTNWVVGTVPEYTETMNECDIDLMDLLAQEQKGLRTQLREAYSVAARALGAASLLVDNDGFQRALKNYNPNRTDYLAT